MNASRCALLLCLCGMNRQGLLESGRKGDDAMLVALAFVYAPLAAVDIRVFETDVDQLAHPRACGEQSLYEYDVQGSADLPHGLIEGTDLLFGRHAGQLLGRFLRFDLELFPEDSG